MNIKQILKKIVIHIITLEAKLVLKKFRPQVIAVTGSVGKTSTKDAVFSSLSKHIHIRKNQKSFNSEIGVPLTILGLDNGYSDFSKWFLNIVEGALAVFKKEYPEILVLEFGVDRPGDMQGLVNWIPIDIAIFTVFPNVPVHVEYFNSPKEVIEEKKKMLKGVKENGYVILNADDAKVLAIKEESKRKVITFGIENDSDIKV
jgi:UDP-N-acetylmuramoyl-tripeptide--D-alanyl-D-alanine ligase